MSPRRLGAASVSLVLLLLALAAGASVRAMEPVVERLPDLGMAPLQDFSIDRKGNGTVWLRFDTIIVNVGDGPFEAYGYKAGTTGEAADERRDVEQRIFSSDDSYVDEQTPAWMFWARDGHNHWHVNELQTWHLGFAATPNEVIAIGKKTGFCFWDNHRYGSPSNALYHPSTTSACAEKNGAVPMGQSVGWGDNYPSTLADQYIDISGMPWGDYALTVTADPRNEFREVDETNNTVRAFIRTRPNGVEVLSQEGYVQPIDSETDAPPTVELTEPADGSTVSGVVSVKANAFDDRGVTQVEFFAGSSPIGTDTAGSDGWTATWDTSALSAGTHILSAVATDTNGATASDAVAVTVDDGSGGGGSSDAMTISLGTSSSSQGSTWTAHATVLVTGGDPAAGLAGATVTYHWSADPAQTCTTGSDGTCAELTLGGIPKRTASVTFTVDEVTHPDYAKAGPLSATIAKP